MKFIEREAQGEITPESIGITTREQYWKRLWMLKGYNMALITPKERRAAYAKALIKIAENVGEAPLPAWQRCIDNPEFFDAWAKRINSGEYDDQIVQRESEGQDEALSSFGVGTS